jgi:potassium-dependent mechanosensitive channel
VNTYSKAKVSFLFICTIMAILLVGSFANIGWPAENGLPFSNHSDLKESIQEALNTENKNLDTYTSQLNQIDRLKKQLLSELNTYNIQLTIYSNLVILPETSVKSLEKGLLDIQTSLHNIENRSNELPLKHIEANQLLKRTDNQISLTEKQISEIKSSGNASSEALELSTKLKDLSVTLDKKREILKKLFSLYSEIIVPVDETKTKFLELAEKFEQMINQKKKQDLLQRKDPFVNLQWSQIHNDFSMTLDQLKLFTTKEFWNRELSFFINSGMLFKVSFILVFCVIQVLVFRLRQSLGQWVEIPLFTERSWNRLLICVLRQSIRLLGTTLFLYAYMQADLFQTKAPIIKVVVDILFLWLFTGWCMDAVRLYAEDKEKIPRQTVKSLHLLVILIRYFAVVHILFSWLHPGESTILILWRLGFEVSLYGWVLYFWKVYYQQNLLTSAESLKKIPVHISILKALSYFIILSGLILELAGYGLLAIFWHISWGRTIVAVIWGTLVFFALREWNPKLFEVQDADLDEAQTTKSSIRWVIVHLSMLAWFGCLVVLMVLAWGGKQAVLIGIFHFLQHSFQVGNMQFSLLGFIIAIFILLITQAVAKIWGHFFRENILKESGMEEGLQDSIITITVYIIWMLGIIFALNAFGFNATTLTVVLGALGVGLGFGLQTIFNNFISGIILLFERPIQVGDDIETNGIWATVKKINVRSTVVQTYDNASLIIPNSDLISSQVTNWSFKDKRLRRNISVGVAYGSDIELVKKTLLEVAENTPRVLKSPKPDVIFKDFGDNALIFILRIWTRVNYFYAVETEVRFMIDHLFRERNIVIAFPQRDIHIVSENDGNKLK